MKILIYDTISLCTRPLRNFHYSMIVESNKEKTFVKNFYSDMFRNGVGNDHCSGFLRGTLLLAIYFSRDTIISHINDGQAI